MRRFAPVAIAAMLAMAPGVGAQPSVAGVFPGERVRVSAWGSPPQRVTIGRFVSRDARSVSLLTCSTCDTTRIPWALVDRFEVHVGGNATAFNVSRAAIGVGAIGGAVVTAVSMRRTACRGEGALICGPATMMVVPIGFILGTLPGVVAALVTHERWWDVPLRPGSPITISGQKIDPAIYPSRSLRAAPRNPPRIRVKKQPN